MLLSELNKIYFFLKGKTMGLTMTEQVSGDQTLFLSPSLNDLPTYSVYTVEDPNMGCG